MSSQWWDGRDRAITSKGPVVHGVHEFSESLDWRKSRVVRGPVGRQHWKGGEAAGFVSGGHGASDYP